MKPKLISILLIFSIYSYSQDYVTFPVDNAKWGIMFDCQDDPYHYFYQYTSFGDTTINELDYHRLKAKYAKHYAYWEPSWISDSLSSYYYREEDKRIYFYDLNRQKEILYYDFNLESSDTFVFEGYDSLLVIENVEYYGRQGLRLQTINNPYLGQYWSVVWIQEIGSLNGIIHPNGYSGCSSDLTCFLHNDYNPLNCGLIDSILFTQENNQSNNIIIHPNPSKGELIITFINRNISDLRIYSLDNKLVILNKPTMYYDELQIDISHLESGIYILKFTNGNRVITKKFIKN